MTQLAYWRFLRRTFAVLTVACVGMWFAEDMRFWHITDSRFWACSTVLFWASFNMFAAEEQEAARKEIQP